MIPDLSLGCLKQTVYFYPVREDIQHLIALSRIPKVGPILGRQLVGYCGSAAAVFRTPVRQLARIPQIGTILARAVRDNRDLAYREAETELQHIQELGITPIAYLDPNYPRRLAHFEESPLVLYLQGQANLQALRTVGIIGTRRPTPAGRHLAEELVHHLAPYQPLIVSGLAHGIDGTAHQAAIHHNVPTLGILGCGLGQVYPAAHRSLYDQMRQSPHGLMTEFLADQRPDKENFPMRNRVIAALSDAVVVIESKEKGGSMITAEFANRYNKDVFAVPGRVTDPASRGCNLLIKHQRAHLLESGEDLTRLLRWDAENQRVQQPSLFDHLPEAEQAIIDLLMETPEASLDEIGVRLARPPADLAASLLQLEFRGLIHQLPGKRFLLQRSAKANSM